MKKYIILIIAIVSIGCSARGVVALKDSRSYQRYHSFVINAESKATPQARKVMRIARGMLESREVIQGACWDYLDAAFTRAGYSSKSRSTIYHSQKNGPYVELSRLKAGDWVYHVNHSYGGIEHSGMFIGWLDYDKKIALSLSYAGEGRAEPARYRKYDFSSVYHITRAQ